MHQVKEGFDKLRGFALFLNKSQAVSWYGLASLIFKMKNGDVYLGPRAASEADFELYMKKGFKEQLIPSPAPKKNTPVPPYSPDQAEVSPDASFSPKSQ